ncbi:MAG: DUF971 domain-containing protein [Bacteroidota bacterium]|nr:DUF971 domain-containing protein [Bacteroidota bacterium]MDP4191567.1 DUF971 domain-containing protein [Bacteroidota bacterium]MDP4196193.1 DUF971 domain-containing protein [Bacteroidota bacterium]
MSPRQIRLHENRNLKIKWDNGSESIIALKHLRDQCPCEYCKEDNKPRQFTEGMYSILNVKIKGCFAAQISWKDGHNKGLYTWDYLKSLSEPQSEKPDNKF